MRIRGNDMVSTYLFKGQDILEINPQPLETSILEGYEEVQLEVGCGRGSFLAQMASLHPQVFFIGVEKFIPIIARASALSANLKLANVRFYKTDIGQAIGIFPVNIFSKIYLNFSDPWPKRRQEKHRLTHPRFLNIYNTLLAPNGSIEFKTDNQALFEWSIQSLEKSGWILDAIDRNVPDEPPVEEKGTGKYVRTEYESRFRGLLQPIFFLRGTPPTTDQKSLDIP